MLPDFYPEHHTHPFFLLFPHTAVHFQHMGYVAHASCHHFYFSIRVAKVEGTNFININIGKSLNQSVQYKRLYPFFFPWYEKRFEKYYGLNH